AAARRTASASSDETNNSATSVPSFKSSAKSEAAEREVIFSIDDKEYSVPKVFGVNMTLKFFNNVRTQGELAGGLALLEDALGTEDFEALLNWTELTDDIFAQITDMVVDRAINERSGSAGK